MKESYDLVVIGGGAAGFFTAIQCAERNPLLRIVLLEKSNQVLSKVRISGGGRCNVTHACFDPSEMVTNYPRGHQELLGPFHTFLCGDMMAWLDDHGVPTKIEEDGRVFPVSDSSSSIIDCFLQACEKHQIDILTQCGVSHLKKTDNGWEVIGGSQVFQAANIMIATGSSPSTWKMIETLGHSIVAPVPSLFTFNIQHYLLQGLQGISLPTAHLQIPDLSLESEGPMLITHWGLSGPAVLKLSAWAARELQSVHYRFSLLINWTGEKKEAIHQTIQTYRQVHGKKVVVNLPYPGIPRRLWQSLTHFLPEKINYGTMNAAQMDQLVNMLFECRLPVNGKSTFKEEFVTCGGIDTSEVDFRTMQSKLHSNLFFAGEVLNVDAVTGGFNFQAAWTSAWIAADAICQSK